MLLNETFFYSKILHAYAILEQAVLKFIYSEKDTKFCQIFALLLTVRTVVKSKVEISQNFVAFS